MWSETQSSHALAQQAPSEEEHGQQTEDHQLLCSKSRCRKSICSSSQFHLSRVTRSVHPERLYSLQNEVKASTTCPISSCLRGWGMRWLRLPRRVSRAVETAMERAVATMPDRGRS